MMNGRLAALTMIAALACAGLSAHEGHAHKVMGTVAAIDAAHLELEKKDGSKESFVLTKETRYLRGKALGTVTDVRVGERAVVSVIEKEGKKRVTELLLGDDKGSAASSREH